MPTQKKTFVCSSVWIHFVPFDVCYLCMSLLVPLLALFIWYTLDFEYPYFVLFLSFALKKEQARVRQKMRFQCSMLSKFIFRTVFRICCGGLLIQTIDSFQMLHSNSMIFTNKILDDSLIESNWYWNIQFVKMQLMKKLMEKPTKTKKKDSTKNKNSTRSQYNRFRFVHNSGQSRMQSWGFFFFFLLMRLRILNAFHFESFHVILRAFNCCIFPFAEMKFKKQSI